MENAKSLTITYLIKTTLASLNGSDKELITFQVLRR